MKYLLVLLVVVVAVGLWRSRRREAGDRTEPAARRETRLAAPERMVACAHCGLHLPAADALADDQGHWFCSRQHGRQFADRARP